jgi:Domain of unknown function (DUF4082)/Bacterial Ig-like domain
MPAAAPRKRGRRVVLAALVVAVSWLVSMLWPGTASADVCGSVVYTNPVACENSLPGNPQSEWDVPLDPSPTIEGFATDISVDHGQTVHFKVNTSASAYRIDIYRLGYYNGMGARKVATVNPSVLLPQIQPACLRDSTTSLVDCGNWAESASWAVPADAVSGVYVARLVRTDTGEANHIIFVVRDDESHSNLLFKTSDTTWEAYNGWGGASLYNGTNGRAYKVSYNRPFDTRVTGNGRSFFFTSEYPMVRFLERNGYDVSYFTSVDASRFGSKILDHKTLLSVGHDEYWSADERANVTAARDSGVNLAFFSGNEMFWKTRWEPSIDGSNTSYRTLVCYKETLDSAKIDPTPTWTGTWRDPRFSPPADGGRPENAVSGQLFMVNADRSDPMYVPAQYSKLRFWRNTDIANLAPGQTATLPTGVLGYEWDEDTDNGLRPAGEFDMSSSTYAVSTYLYQYGADYGNGTATHHLTMYRASSGALVFGAGTVQWSFGLDATHDYGGTPTDPRMQQATVNLLADMGAQPATLDPSLVAATQSTDTTAPTSTITSPAPNTNLAPGAVTITGTASDAGGGVVAGVEVSTDGGGTWHPATGTTNWSYTWTQGITTTTIKSRAVDDSGNIETPSAGVPVTVGQTSCPCTIWGPSATPVTVDSGDAGSYELGVRIRSDVDGYVTGIRFYKASQNTGTHVGRLWTNSGTLLASATFSNESGSGWQQVSFSNPVAVTANTTYVASYSDPNGHFSLDRPAFATAGVDNPPMHALKDGLDGADGVYANSPGFFPTSSTGSSNYWVDAVFVKQNSSDTTPPTVTSVAPPSAATGVPTGATVTAQFSEGMDPTTITGTTFQLRDGSGTPVPATLSYVASTNTATLTPNAPLASSATYTATVAGGTSGVKDAAGNALAADYTWSFTTGAPGVCPCSIWSSAATPQVADSGDPGSYELGVRFRSDTAGSISGIRFYKASQNTGTHIGRLWTNSGTLLASATFTSESGSGWQQVTFPTPVAINANTTYVASYSDPSGHYSVDRSAFASAGVDSPPLHALKDGLDGANGVYADGPGFFPASTSGSSNYWVDVVFNKADTAGPTVTSVSPAAGATGVAVGTAVTAQFSRALDATTVGSATFQLKDSAGNAVPAGVTYNASSNTATLAPNAALVAGTTYSATIQGGSSGVKDTAGNPLPADYVWSFTTAMPATCPCSIWSSSATPTTVDSLDPGSYELGVRFRSDLAGWITGIRFYKGAQNTGMHVGRLWANNGTLLASATFTSETGSGWQTVSFSTPVAVTANTTYVASYSDPSGHYSVDRSAFAGAGVDSPPLHALKDGLDGANGVYADGPGFFPASTSGSSNYWVDVVFSNTDATPPTSTTSFPAAGATYGPSAWNTGCASAGFCGTASDVGSGVQKVELSIRQGSGSYWDGTGFSSATEIFNTAALTGSSWSYAFAGTNFPVAGSYTISVRATDNAGNVETATTRTFTYDGTPPSSTTTFPAANGSYNAAGWGAGCFPTGFCGNVTDPGAGVQKVELSIRQGSGNYWNGTAFSSTTEIFNTATLTGSGWSYGFAAANFPGTGSYTISVRGTDTVGNVETANTRTFTYDVTPPSSSTTFPVASGNYNAAGWAAGCSTAGFCGTDSDLGSGVQKVELSIRQGSGSYWNGTGFSSTTEVFNTVTLTGSSWAYAFAAASFPANTTYTFRVRTTDAAGNSATVAGVTFRYDTSLPNATYTFPASGGSYNATRWTAGCATPGLCGSDSDAGSGVQKVELSLRRGTGNYWDGTAFASANEVFVPATLTGSTWSFAFPAANFPADGSYTARLRATDKAGNVQTPVSRSFTYDTTPPSVSAVTPAPGATGVSISANSTVTFNEPMTGASFTTSTFVLRDPAGNAVFANISYNNGQRRATLSPPATLVGLTTYTATVIGGPGGVTDAAGNPLPANYSWSFTTRCCN